MGAHENGLSDFYNDFFNVLQLLQKYTYWLINTYTNMICGDFFIEYTGKRA